MSDGRQPFTLRALIKVTRFWNLVIIVLAQFFTAYCLVGYFTVLNWRLYLLSVSTALIAAAGYIINDYYDVKIDLINKPERVVVGKSMRRRYALFFHWMLSILGVAAGFLLDWKIGVINIFSGFLLWWYSNFLKRKPFVGNFSVALLTGLSVYQVAVLFDPFNKMIIAYSFFSFFVTLVREIIKDMEDWKGDNTFGCQTLPILWGIRRTKIFIYTLILIHVTAIVSFNSLYLFFQIRILTFFIFIPILLLILLLVRADTVKSFYYLSFYCKIILVAGIFSMLLI
jgi:4-hydroxybenzoate polyprenyltransferase